MGEHRINDIKARPFLKWAGGKGKLLGTLVKYLPKGFAERESITYVEPFVGGGAMLFHMLSSYPSITRVIINDINEDLISCYKLIKSSEMMESLLSSLKSMSESFLSLDSEEERKQYYLRARDMYNELRRVKGNEAVLLSRAAYFIFLNHTCYNGLYRENSRGDFNVPCGRYTHPAVFNEAVIRAVHLALQSTEILCGSFTGVRELIRDDEYTFIYIDPPYRPLLGSASFKDYTKHIFDDAQQEKLKIFADTLSMHSIMISNSDSLTEDGDDYFAGLYSKKDGYYMHKVLAPRSINSDGEGRGQQLESLITNYLV